jgi:hypothetical protein
MLLFFLQQQQHKHPHTKYHRATTTLGYKLVLKKSGRERAKQIQTEMSTILKKSLRKKTINFLLCRQNKVFRDITKKNCQTANATFLLLFQRLEQNA